MTDEKKKLTPEELAALSRDTLNRVAGLIYTLGTHHTEGFHVSELKDRQEPLSVALLTAMESVGGFFHMCEHPYGFHEATILSRTILEKVINAAYLAVCSEQALTDYFDYAKQHTYRRHDRKVGFGDYQIHMRMMGTPEDPSTVPGLSEALERFTSRRGRERKDWCREHDSAWRRLKFVVENCPNGLDGIALMAAHDMIWDDASELAHGSPAGLFSQLLGHPPKREDASRLEQLRHRNTFQVAGLQVWLSLAFSTLHVVVAASADTPHISRVSQQAREAAWSLVFAYQGTELPESFKAKDD